MNKGSYCWIDAILKAELYHALDNNKIAKTIVENNRESIPKPFLKNFINFYDVMENRFSLSHKVDKFQKIIKSLQSLPVLGVKQTISVYDENQVIVSVYEKFRDILKGIEQESFNANNFKGIIEKAVHSSSLNFFDPKTLQHEIEQKSCCKVSDSGFKNAAKDYITPKRERYEKKEDRLPYWGKGSKAPELKDISPLFQEDKFIKFVIYLLTKYQIKLHEIVHTEDQTLEKLISGYQLRTRNFKRCANVFTFIRLMAKFVRWPDTDTNKEDDYSHMIQAWSLIRRGYTHLLMNEHEKAFNDYTYAEAEIRELGKHKDKSDLCRLYTAFLPPLIYCYKGELYRQDYAYRNAFQYYCAAVVRFQTIIDHDEEDTRVAASEKNNLLNSFALVKAKVNKGKTFLELGEFRRSLKWFIKSLLSAVDIFFNQETPNNIKVEFKKACTYLEKTKYDPIIDKKETHDKVKGLTNALGRAVNEGKLERSEKNISILLSDIMNRISLVLNILNIPDFSKSKVNKVRNKLSFQWLCMALKLHPQNALAQFNRIIFRAIAENLDQSLSAFNELDKKYSIVTHTSANYQFDKGGIFERLNRSFALCALKSIGRIEGSSDKEGNDIARKLLYKYFYYTHNFSIKNAEIYKYLMRKRVINEKEASRFKKNCIYIYCLQRWSSFTPAIPRPSTFNIQGGGYFIIYNEKGIVIDPGFDFLENFYAEGFSIADIDAIIITHDHMDHCDDLDSILSLVNDRIKRELPENQERHIDLFMNTTMAARYSFLHEYSQAKVKRSNPYSKILKKKWLTYHIHTLGVNTSHMLSKKYQLEIESIRTNHPELATRDYSVGVILTYHDLQNDKKVNIGITSDTALTDPVRPKDSNVISRFLNPEKPLSVFITHMNSTPYRELKNMLHSKVKDTYMIQKCITESLLKKSHEDLKLIGNQFLYSYWYNRDCLKQMFSLEKPKDLTDHLLFQGTRDAFNKFKEQCKENKKNKAIRLMVISEFREEMGSYRNKVAHFLNESLSKKEKEKLKCFSADIGFVIQCEPDSGALTIRCTQCNHNNDYGIEDRYYHPLDITEVCVKSEDEGMFYFCPHHDPEPRKSTKLTKSYERYQFAEKIEGYNLFKEINIR